MKQNYKDLRWRKKDIDQKLKNLKKGEKSKEFRKQDTLKDMEQPPQQAENLLERLIKQELKVLNGKKMVRN